MLWTAHLLPDGVGVAVVPVHTKFLDAYSLRGQAEYRNRYLCGRGSHVIIVVVPEEHVQLTGISRGDGADVRLRSYAVLKNIFDRHGPCAFHPHPVSTSLPYMRKTLSTALSMPLVASSRKPAK